MARRIVTLDGPAGVGKTTLAKRVAAALGVAYLDTGAMFRGVAWRLGAEAPAWDDPQLATALAPLVFGLTGTGADSQVTLDGHPLPPAIRSEGLGLLASELAGRVPVRAFLKQAQQAIGAHVDLVVEGRDMGTVVFPQAWRKFFLDASPQERARRRYLQLTAMGETADLATITRQLQVRDAQDRNRPIAPLRPAEDAILVDTSELTIDGVFHVLMGGLRP